MKGASGRSERPALRVLKNRVSSAAYSRLALGVAPKRKSRATTTFRLRTSPNSPPS